MGQSFRLPVPKIVQRMAVKVLQHTISLRGSSAQWWNILDSDRKVLISEFTGSGSFGKAYRDCAPVSAIINKQAKAFSNGKVMLVGPDGKEPRQSREIKRLEGLLKKPNPIQSWNQFISQAYANRKVYGFTVIFINTPEGFDNSNAKGLWVLPGAYVDVKSTGYFMSSETTGDLIQEVRFAGATLDLSRLMVWQDTHINTQSDLRNNLFSDSRLRSLKEQINNIYAAYEARGVLITRRGAIGILTSKGTDANGPMGIDPDEKIRIQEEHFKSYGLSRGQSSIIITDASLEWQQMAIPTKDLMLFEEVEDDVRQLCDSLEYPFELLGFKSTGALGDQNRVKEAKKQLYQDVLIPEGEDLIQILNEGLNVASLGVILTISFEHIDVLQTSNKEKNEAARALVQALEREFLLNIITLNQWLESRGWPTVPDGDKYHFQLIAEGRSVPAQPQTIIQQQS